MVKKGLIIWSLKITAELILIQLLSMVAQGDAQVSSMNAVNNLNNNGGTIATTQIQNQINHNYGSGLNQEQSQDRNGSNLNSSYVKSAEDAAPVKQKTQKIPNKFEKNMSNMADIKKKKIANRKQSNHATKTHKTHNVTGDSDRQHGHNASNKDNRAR